MYGRSLFAGIAGALAVIALAVGCGGGGSTSSAPPVPTGTATPTPSPTPTPATTATPTPSPTPTPKTTATPTPTPTATPTATPTPTPTPTPGILTVSTSSLSFGAVGSTLTFTVSETNYAGSFTATIDTPTIAKIAANGTTFTVTANAVGTATIIVKDVNGQRATITVTVTATGGTLS
jgi:hypothetical protein